MIKTITNERFQNANVDLFAFITVYDSDGYQLIHDMAEAIQRDLRKCTTIEVARHIVEEVPCRIEEVFSGNTTNYNIYVL